MSEQTPDVDVDVIECPFCHQQTPKGAFCANCGRSLANLPGGPTDEPIDPLNPADPEIIDDGDADIEGVKAAEAEARTAVAKRVESAPDQAPPPPIEPPPGNEKGRYFRSRLGKALSLGGRNEEDPVFTAIEERQRRPIEDYRRMAGIALLAVLIALLFNNAGIAILLAVFVVPALALLYLTDLDLFEREPWSAILGSLGSGFVIGLVFGTISAWLTGKFWIEGATFYAGAAGYGARFAEAEGAAPIGWVLLGGIILPAVIVIGCAVAPILMRRFPVLRNEVMDGLTLGAAAGAGYAAATTIVHYWPAIVRDQNPGGDISDWTATLSGLIVVRPLLFAGFAALLCASIWQYALDQRSSSLINGVVSGLGGIVLYSLVDMLIQPAGAAAELIWQLATLFVLWFVIRRAIRNALAHDALVFARAGGNSILCPTCRRLTPDGTFCANCGAELHPAPEAKPKPSATVETSLPDRSK
ncbi:hypothetical protein BH09CHL1_BH09CHL1_01430 [soil metagenome]